MEYSNVMVHAGKIFCADKMMDHAAVIIRDGIITEITDEFDTLPGYETYSYPEMQLLPGLIDTHIHGANGYDIMMGNFTALNEISKYLASEGTTSFIPTTVTDELSNIKKALENVWQCMGKVEGARILGSYVEGPYITAQYKGAHNEKLMRPISLQEIEGLLAVSQNTVKTVTVAPEKPEALAMIQYLRAKNIHVSIGHTNATYEEVQQAAAAGADIAVHTFNGMRGLHHREPGTVGGVLVNDNIYAELIADFIHVHPAAMEILLRCKPKDKVILMSDAMQATGLPDGEYQLGPLTVMVKESVARIANGSLAGSTTSVMKAVRGLIKNMSIHPMQAVNLASINPAKMLGLDDCIGSIARGKKADLVVVDDDFNVVVTFVEGKVIYKA